MVQNLFKKAKQRDRNLSEDSSIRGRGKGRSEVHFRQRSNNFFSAGLRIFFLLLTRIDDDVNKRAGKKTETTVTKHFLDPLQYS